ncbi:MAG: outer membrane protein assembly factor [Gammaproteobacteria bacterium]|nr:outer membrane protein assembly factor [Gammaproteobacteria bacterium]MCP5136317.1 outer membrane protein assembly factor [Gammaproteobacteria bacterium]
MLRLILTAALVFAACSAFGNDATPQIQIESTLPVAEVDQLRAALSLAAEPCNAPQWRLDRRRRNVAAEMEPGLRALGYYQPAIEVEIPTAEARDDGCWSAEIRLDPGTQVIWRAIDLELDGEGASDPVLAGITAKPGLEPGMPLTHADYAALKNRLLRVALERGYLDSMYSVSQLRVDPKRGVADAVLHFDTGARYRIGRIEIADGGLSAERSARILGLHEGDPYSAAAIEAAYRRMRDAGYFRGVEVAPDLNPNPEHRIPVRVALTGVPAKAWRFGVGFDTDTGPRVTAGHAYRRINESGHQLDINALASRDVSELSSEYRIPGEDPINERWAIQAGLRDEVTADIDSALITLGTNYSHKAVYAGFDEPLTETLGLAYREEDSRIADEIDQSTLLLPSVEWLWVPKLATGDGASVRLGIKAAHTALISDTSFTQLSLGVRAQHRVNADWTLLGRMDLGLSAASAFATLPASQRFFAGGDNSVRGYGFKRLGPHNASGQVVGGRHLIVLSTEVERRLTESWGIATFLDAGNAFNSRPELEYGYGLGARWNSPIGKVKLDFAIPSDTARDDFRLHFSLGTAF